MNAYELADKLNAFVNTDIWCPDKTLQQASIMLRQQADRIAELDKQVGIFDAELMKARISNSLMKDDRDRLAKGHKELSDEEIENIAFNYVYEDDELDIVSFARAIIKASRGEK